MPAGTAAEVWIADLPPYSYTAVYYSSPPDPNPFASSSWSPPIGVGSPESMSPGTLLHHGYDEGRRYEQILQPRRPGAKRHRVSGYESDVDKPPRGIRAYRTPPPQSHVVGDPRPQSRNRKPTVVDQLSDRNYRIHITIANRPNNHQLLSVRPTSGLICLSLLIRPRIILRNLRLLLSILPTGDPNHLSLSKPARFPPSLLSL
ncbi:hypothetical protein BDZ97DRAFT_1867502 [Flammula alnicola]|nr:hypothetical protein BDZ97DRAFT_1867502 [Flammula alnicola]